MLLARVTMSENKKPFGIYDDSPDLHRAIAMSSGYFGDGSSSVFTLYRATRKPLMIQNTEITEQIAAETKEEYLHSDVIGFGARLLSLADFKSEYPEWYEYWLPLRNAGQTKYILITDYEYGTSLFLNAIYRLDEEKGRAEFFKRFPVDDCNAWLYRVPIRIKNRMIFIPARARKWAFYDLETGEWTFEEVPQEFYPSNKWRAAFGWGCLYDDEIIIWPGESGVFARYNIETRMITYHKEWIAELPNGIENADCGIVCGVVFYRESLLIVSQQTNRIIEINPETMAVVKSYAIGDDNRGFRSAILIPGTTIIYLIKFREPGQEPWTETIVKWNIETNQIVELKDFPINLIDGHTQNAFSGFLYWRDKLFAIPLQGDSVLRIDLTTDDTTRVELNPRFDFFERKSDYYNNWAKDTALPFLVFNGKRMTFMAQLPCDYSLADIDFETGEISNRRKWVVDGIENLYHQKGKTSGDTVYENQNYLLEDFLDDLSAGRPTLIIENSGTVTDSPINAMDGTSGKAIYDYVKTLAGV
jgi:hypothetical protein